MSSTQYLSDPDADTVTYQMGDHAGIPSPTYLPELKGYEGLHVILDHIQSLDDHNPIVVPAAAWEKISTMQNIKNRTDEDGNDIGEEEVKSLEENHPLLFYDPPELYNYRLTKTLVNYLFKYSAYEKDAFEAELIAGNHADAFRILPQFHHPFLHANINRVLEETDGASQISPDEKQISTTKEAWAEQTDETIQSYFGDIVADASTRPSAVMVPPVPQLESDMSDGIVDMWTTTNQIMADLAAESGVDSYYHVYLNYNAFDPDAAHDNAEDALSVVEEEVATGDFAGIALTIHHPNRIWQTGRAARVTTFLNNLSRVRREYRIPVVAPRSEWFGSYSTDRGVDAFSSLLNGAWQYQRYSSDGGPTGTDQYGRTMIPNEARALKLEADENQDLVGYLEANGDLPSFGTLPDTPPTFDSDGSTMNERYGTAPQFRRTFGKPRRLAHVQEAQQFREEAEDGVNQPAREYLKDSKNPYIEF